MKLNLGCCHSPLQPDRQAEISVPAKFRVFSERTPQTQDGPWLTNVLQAVKP
jgi:hypothetical protein